MMSEYYYLMIRSQVGDSLGYITYATVIKAGNRVIKDHWNRVIAHSGFGDKVCDCENFLLTLGKDFRRAMTSCQRFLPLRLA